MKVILELTDVKPLTAMNTHTHSLVGITMVGTICTLLCVF